MRGGRTRSVSFTTIAVLTACLSCGEGGKLVSRLDGSTSVPPVDGSTSMPPSDAGGAVPSSWTEGATMPTVRTELAAAELEGKIYVAGGYGGLHAFEAYDPKGDTWTKLKDMPVDREHPSL